MLPHIFFFLTQKGATKVAGPSNFAYVAKISIDPFEDRETYFEDVKMQMYAKEWAKKFNKFNPPKAVDFVKAGVLELIQRESSPLYEQFSLSIIFFVFFFPFCLVEADQITRFLLMLVVEWNDSLMVHM
jgi:hypothetical protein